MPKKYIWLKDVIFPKSETQSKTKKSNTINNEKPQQFWAWFTEHLEPLTMMSDLPEAQQTELLDQLQAQLTAYCDGLTYEISDPTPNGRTLTLSAEGDIELFPQLVALTDAAPDFDWWEIVPFKQPRGVDLRVIFDQYTFETAHMKFQQLENDIEPDILGLRIALPNPSRDDEDQLVGVYVTLEALLGEFDCATLVGYLETCPLPANDDSSFQPLDDLPEFVEWFKKQRDKE